jgi:hypothetical protein
MAWIPITEAKILTKVSGAELSALRAAALGAGQADPVAEIITQITDEIHGYIPAHITRGAADTIPSRLLGAALDRVVWEIMKRPAASIVDDANGSRAKANAAAIRLFERVQEGAFAIEDPATGESATGAGTQTVNAPVPREDFNGL